MAFPASSRKNRVYPDDGAALVVLDNADFGDADTAIADAIEDQLFTASDGAGRARAVFDMVRTGRIDRDQLTTNGKAYFTPAVLADYRSGLGPLGEPTSVVQISSGLRGGLTVQRFNFDFGSRKLRVTMAGRARGQWAYRRIRAVPDWIDRMSPMGRLGGSTRK